LQVAVWVGVWQQKSERQEKDSQPWFQALCKSRLSDTESAQSMKQPSATNILVKLTGSDIDVPRFEWAKFVLFIGGCNLPSQKIAHGINCYMNIAACFGFVTIMEACTVINLLL
jgi:hypothetical protein